MLKITMKIDGMMCGMCESHVNDAVRRAFSVKKVTSSHSKGETVILTETDISEEQLRAAMEPTGYRVLAISKETYEKKGLLQNTRKPQGFLGRVMLLGMNKGHKPLADWGLSHLPLEADAHVLDVGCGGGANIAALLQRCPEGKVDGLDYSPESVAASKKKNSAALGRRCTVLQGDVGNIPYAQGSYDAVTAFETVYFWPDLPLAFSEILRVLKPSGRFLLVCEMGDPSDTTWTDRIDGMTVYSGEELNGYLERAGFANITLSHKAPWFCLLAEKPAF